MTEIYWLVLGLLFLLAVLDLTVGVSNDAVNFLNSAVGSKVAPFYVILAVASVGILLGASTSSEMMEVARKGIFNPEMFDFRFLLILFAAVMLSDVLLLDAFNTLGLPTSTTVSVVFELLGAAVALAIISTIAQDLNISSLIGFINTDTAVTIIAGIFLSVFIAFAVGALAQFLSRMLFTFQRTAWGPISLALFSAFALTAMMIFLLLKGLKGAAFIPPSAIGYMAENLWWLSLLVFLFWAIVFGVLVRMRVPVLKFVVLAGTFSLAMAFAGNDLVNFVGVPLAAFEAARIYQEGGATAGVSMAPLSQPVRGQTWMLVIAGLIMTVTLWISSKARSVTETEVNLGRQDEGVERFRPGSVSRSVVAAAIWFKDQIVNVMPPQLVQTIARRYRRESTENTSHAAFDLIRASVNLTVASVLIAIATSLKLPLSTTYVSFMVAMGTSFADRAWGRESAVFRISGVLSVITGWFLTAAIAFTVAGSFATLMYFFGLPALIGLVILVAVVLWWTGRVHARRAARKKLFESVAPELSLERLKAVVDSADDAIQHALLGLVNFDQSSLHKADKMADDLSERAVMLERALARVLKSSDVSPSHVGDALELFATQQDLIQATRFIVDRCSSYVANRHPALDDEQKNELNKIGETLQALSEEARNGQTENFADFDSRLDKLAGFQLKGLREDRFHNIGSRLIFALAIELQDWARAVRALDGSRFAKA